jgi:hypothetical protein
MKMSPRDQECVQAFRDEAAYRLRWLVSDLFENGSSLRREVVDAIYQGAYAAVYELEQKRTGWED